jgi:spore germination protein
MQIEVVKPGESLWVIAQRYGRTVEEIASLNGLNPSQTLVIGQALIIPMSGSTYIVQAGDSLWSIAGRFGVTPSSLARLNGIANPALIQVGQRLTIPEAPKPTIEGNAYLVPGTPERDERLVRESAAALTYFSIFEYRVTREGGLVPPSDVAALAAIRETNAVPMMVISNVEEGAFSEHIATAIFDSPTAKERLITNVLRVMREKGFAALNVDFEHMLPSDRTRYNAFLEELRNRLHAEGYLLSTALAPKVSATQVGQWYEAHDYEANGRIADFVVIMTYEWGWSGGPPMAVAPIPQVRRVLDYAASVIPRDKIMMGAPLYGYNWTLPYVAGGPFAPALSPQAAVDLARREGANIQFDASAQAPFYRYWDEQGREHIVWFEDARSMQAKFDLVKEYRLRGISYWRLGTPFPQVWPLMLANFTIRKL